MNLLQLHDRDQLAEFDWLIGVDESGRGCLAGPVMAGACLLGRAFFTSAEAIERSAAINDSKQLSAQARTAQFAVIKSLREQGLLDFEVASGSVEEIQAFNILGATRLAMKRAIQGLAARASSLELPTNAVEGPLFYEKSKLCILVDGRPLKPFPYTHKGLVKGDGKSLAIAIASIAAKVIRDQKMSEIAKAHPEYFFDQHKGYGTVLHRTALRKHGALMIHRKFFLQKILNER